MSWDRFLETGSARLKWRVKIAGAPIEFVSHRSMESDSPVTEAYAISKTIDDYNFMDPPVSQTWRGSGGTVGVVTSGQDGPGGSVVAWLLEDDSGAGSARTEVDTVPTPYVPGSALWGSIFFKKDLASTSFPEIRLEYTSGSNNRIGIRLDTGELSNTVGTWEEYGVTDLGDWWYLYFKHAGDSLAVSFRVAIYPAFGTHTSFPNADGTTTGGATVYGLRIANAGPAGTNLLPAAGSETWTAASVTVTTGQADPLGGTNAVNIDDASGLYGNARADSVAYTSGSEVLVKLWVMKDVTALNFATIKILYDGVQEVAVDLDPVSGTTVVDDGTLEELSVVEEDGWWLVLMKHAGAAASAIRLEVLPASGLVASFDTNSAAATGSITVYAPHISYTFSPYGADPTLGTGIERVNGLSSQGFKFSETVDLSLAQWKAEPFTVKIADIGQNATRLFNQFPLVSTYLTANATSSADSIDVLSTDGFPEYGDLWLNTETVRYFAKTSTSFDELERATFGSGTQAHYISTGGEDARDVEVTQWPQTFEGRRVYVYAYGDGDDPLGDGGNDGEPIWRGIVSTEPRFDGQEWSFTVDSLARILDQELGSDLGEPLGIRGIYYPADAPLAIEIGEGSTASAFLPAAYSNILQFRIAGFWETQTDFLAAINTAIAARLSSAGFTQTGIEAIPYGDGWAIQVTTDSSALWVNILVYSAVDERPDSERAFFIRPGESATTELASLDNSTTYIAPVHGGTVPRTTFGYYSFGLVPLRNDLPADYIDLDEELFPWARLYLNGITAVTASILGVSVTWESEGADSFNAIVSARDASARSLDFVEPSHIVRTPAHPFDVVRYSTVAAQPEVSLSRFMASGSLFDFLWALSLATPDNLNLGATPDFRISDWNPTGLSTWAGELQITANRSYAFATPVKLSELIEHECRLLRAFPCIFSDGSLGFRRLSIPTLTGATSITKANIIVDDQHSYEKSAIGMVNTVTVKTGYNSKEEEHTGDTFIYRNLRALGLTPIARKVEIAPLSRELYRIDPNDIAVIQSGISSMFGVPYAYLTIEVPFTLFSVLVGQNVSVTWTKVPARDGTLGVVERLGLVASRRWEPMTAKGSLTLYLTDTKVGGYVPSSKIASISGASGGTTFVLTLSADYFPSGEDAEDHWEVGDRIHLYRWGSTGTAGNVVGTVTAVSGLTLSVTVAAWTHSGGTWAVSARPSSVISSAKQMGYVYHARSTGRVVWSADSSKPFLLAP